MYTVRCTQYVVHPRSHRSPRATITSSAVCLNVEDPQASAAFACHHLGFTQEMAADGVVSIRRDDAGFNLVFLRTGLPSMKPEALRDCHAAGVLLAFVVEDVDREYTRLQDEGVVITTPIETEPWGERYFQVTDPCGVVLQLVSWEPGADPRSDGTPDEMTATPPA